MIWINQLRLTACFIQGLRAPNECNSGQGTPHYGSVLIDARVNRCWSLRGRGVSPPFNPRLGAGVWINSAYLSPVFLGVLFRAATPGQSVTRHSLSSRLDFMSLP